MQKNQIDDELKKALNELEECDKALNGNDPAKAKLALDNAYERIRLLRRDM